MHRPLTLPLGAPGADPAALVREAAALLGPGLPTLPFGPEDAIAGTETELQTVVEGAREDVDLPLWIEGSRYFANVLKRAGSGDSPRRLASELEGFLDANREGVWENSWVRFPRRVLRSSVRTVLERDLKADRSDPASPPRSDRDRFEWVGPDAEPWVRVPVSYLVKLALADATAPEAGLPALVRNRGRALFENFLSDNTSPETFSFHVSRLAGPRPGDAPAREKAKRFLLTHLLVDYANEAFGLRERGQRAQIYFAPHPPARQRDLARMGFSGFEGRYYSVFECLREDLGRAVELQSLVTAFAFREALSGALEHRGVPDLPSAESERRQVFFDAAIGLPTFFVRHDSGNRFLSRILAKTKGVRASRRYPGYLRMPLAEYRLALVRLLREEAPDLVEALGSGPALDDLALRLVDPAGGAAAGRLNRGILAEHGAGADSEGALEVETREYNEGAERYYRGRLRRRHVDEALGIVEEDLGALGRECDEPRRRTLDRDAQHARADLDRRPSVPLSPTQEDPLVRHAS